MYEFLTIDPSIHGILVQLPLPAHLDEHAILNRIGMIKDVDGKTYYKIIFSC